MPELTLLFVSDYSFSSCRSNLKRELVLRKCEDDQGILYLHFLSLVPSIQAVTHIRTSPQIVPAPIM